MLIFRTELGHPSFDGTRQACAEAARAEDKDLHELLLTYNADEGGHPYILRPRDGSPMAGSSPKPSRLPKACPRTGPGHGA